MARVQILNEKSIKAAEGLKGGPLNNVISSHRHDEREQQNLLFQNFTKTKLFKNALQTGGI